MSNNEREFITLVDEAGVEKEYEIIDYLELDGNEYFAIIDPDDADKAFCEYGIIKLEEENGEKILVTLDDDDEYNKVADLFDERLASEIDYDAYGND